MTIIIARRQFRRTRTNASAAQIDFDKMNWRRQDLSTFHHVIVSVRSGGLVGGNEQLDNRDHSTIAPSRKPSRKVCKKDGKKGVKKGVKNKQKQLRQCSLGSDVPLKRQLR